MKNFLIPNTFDEGVIPGSIKKKTWKYFTGRVIPENFAVEGSDGPSGAPVCGRMALCFVGMKVSLILFFYLKTVRWSEFKKT